MGVQTVEATGKRWKAIQLGGCLSVLASFVVAGIGFAYVESSTVMGAVVSLLMLGGFVAYIVGRVGAWWHHG